LGEHNYVYNENGYVDFVQTELYRILSYNTNWKQDVLNRIVEVRWFVGEEYVDSNATTPYNPTNSMLQNVWADDED